MRPRFYSPFWLAGGILTPALWTGRDEDHHDDL
jgi:hypothetical protein